MYRWLYVNAVLHCDKRTWFIMIMTKQCNSRNTMNNELVQEKQSMIFLDDEEKDAGLIKHKDMLILVTEWSIGWFRSSFLKLFVFDYEIEMKLIFQIYLAPQRACLRVNITAIVFRSNIMLVMTNTKEEWKERKMIVSFVLWYMWGNFFL